MLIQIDTADARDPHLCSQCDGREALMLSPDEQNVVDELGQDVGMSVIASMRPYSVACPDAICRAPLGTCCLTAGGTVRDEPHSSRIRLATRRYGRL